MDFLRIMVAAAGFAVAGSAALAWGDMYRGDATHQPTNMTLMHSYNAPNYCPPGLQPVQVAGEICCGVPNAGAYVDRPGKVHHKPAPRPVRHAPRAYAPVGEKGVIYR